jgi:hypothetical protein
MEVKMAKKNIGSTLESLFEETGELGEVRERVSKRIFAEQLRRAMQKKKVSTSEMARRMGTSRSAVTRVLDPAFPGVTLDSLVRASAAVGMRLEPRLVEGGTPARSQRKPARPANGRTKKPLPECKYGVRR